MTTTSTNETKQKDNPPKEGSKPEKGKSAASKSAASGRTVAGYAAIFQHWEPVPVEDGPVEVDPSKLIAIFDVRNTAQPIDDFVKQCAGGINTPVKITRMKYLGPDGEQAVSPDPKGRVSLKCGAEYNVLVYGRRRTRAALKLSFKVLKAELKTYKSWQGMLDDAYTENDARTDMTTWDRACHIKNMRDGGMLQDQIAEQIKMSSGLVSQYLGVFDLPEPVQKMIGNGELTVTSVRVLRPLKDQDPDAVAALAARSVEKGWTEDQLREAVASFLAKHSGSGEEGKKGKKGKKVNRVVDYDRAEVSFLGVKKIRPLLNYAATTLKMIRAKAVDETPEAQRKHAEKVGEAKGYLRGLLESAGLKEPPAAAFAVEEESEGE